MSLSFYTLASDVYITKKLKTFEGESVGRSVVSDSVRPRGLQPARLLCPWDSPDEHWSGLPCPPPTLQIMQAYLHKICSSATKYWDKTDNVQLSTSLFSIK